MANFKKEEARAKFLGPDGVLRIVSRKILQTQLCEQFALGGLTVDLAQDKILQKIHPTHKMDLVIRTRFLHRVSHRIHDKVCEYLYLAVQGLLADQKESFLEAGLGGKAEQKEADVLSLLRFLDCLTWAGKALTRMPLSSS